MLIGVIAGMFGVGGGFMLTPLLHIVFRIPMPIAVGSALSQKIGTSIGSFLKHRQFGHGEVRADWFMLGGSLFGVDAGARALAFLAGSGSVAIHGRQVPVVTLTLDGIYAMLLIGSALSTLMGARSGAREGDGKNTPPLLRIRIPPYAALPGVGIEEASVTVMAYIGFATGFLSGLLGIGGGVLLLPVLIYGYGFPIKHAAGSGILLLFVTVLVGTVEHAWRGNVDLRVALSILAGSSLGSQLGARATAKLSAQALRYCFAALLFATVAGIATDVLRQLTS